MAADPKDHVQNLEEESHTTGPAPSAPEWTWVDQVKPINEVVRRDPPGGVLEPTGHLSHNAEASDMWDQIAVEHGMDPDMAAARFGTNEESRTVIVVPVESGVKGATRVVRNNERHAHAMHLANVFDQYRSLRPVGKQHVLVSKRYNPDGKPYMLIDLQTGQAKATTTREGSQEHQRRAEVKARRESKRKGGSQS
jgi:hypothetical protein